MSPMKKLSIIIPAHNEASRIGKTLIHYTEFFNELKRNHHLDYEIVVVLNGCKDGTKQVVENHINDGPIRIIDLHQAGKGLALTAGFKDALTRNNDLIGFVDADMAT